MSLPKVERANNVVGFLRSLKARIVISEEPGRKVALVVCKTDSHSPLANDTSITIMIIANSRGCTRLTC
jgi:hypothetical protein